MPQTREHFDICRLLGVRSGLVVLTKADAVDGELLELVRAEVEELVAGGVARDAGLAARVYSDSVYDPLLGKDPSEWVVVARRPEDLGPLASDPRWLPLDASTRRLVLWRDDFSDILSVFRRQ